MTNYNYIQCKVCGHTTDAYDNHGVCIDEPEQMTGEGIHSTKLGPWQGCATWAYNLNKFYQFKQAIKKMTRIRTRMVFPSQPECCTFHQSGRRRDVLSSPCGGNVSRWD